MITRINRIEQSCVILWVTTPTQRVNRDYDCNRREFPRVSPLIRNSENFHLELKDCILLMFNATNVRGITQIRNKRLELRVEACFFVFVAIYVERIICKSTKDWKCKIYSDRKVQDIFGSRDISELPTEISILSAMRRIRFLSPVSDHFESLRMNKHNLQGNLFLEATKMRMMPRTREPEIILEKNNRHYNATREFTIINYSAV